MEQVNEVADIDVMDQTSERSLVGPIVLLALAILYDLSPVDIVPDFPVIGYIDDLIITAIATLNLLQKWLENFSMAFARLLGLMKWMVIFVGIIAISLLGLAAWGVVKLFTA
ncbi:MAG: DUF1232 domain-containing protein [Pseudomonadota bacterium]|nr:DUF1232 domain-containing protein [Pseudomonadota bacterium]